MSRRIVVLTGANRGLGQRTAEILLEKYSDGFHYIFTQRSANHTELRAALREKNPFASFDIKQLELTDKSSRSDLLKEIQSKHKNLDIIFNNAGVYDHVNDNGERPSRKTAEDTLNINFKSTVNFTEEAFPLLSHDAKIIQMSGIAAQLKNQPLEGQQILQNPSLTKQKLFEICDSYINQVEDLNKNLQFGNKVYYLSKAFLTAYVRFVATQYILPNQSVFAVHPGWVQTRIGGPKAPLTVDQASPHLAQLVAGIPFGRHAMSGKFIFKDKPLQF